MKSFAVKIVGFTILAGLLLVAFVPGDSGPGRKYHDYGILNYAGKLHPVFKNKVQRAHFMLTMTSELVAPVPNYCIELLHKRLGKSPLSHVAPDPAPEASSPRSPDFRRPFAVPAVVTGDYSGLMRLTQDGVQNPGNPEDEGCHDALASCGNCHLPKINNCNYTVHYLEGKNTKQVTGKVVERTIGGVKIDPGETARPVMIAAKNIVKSDWLDGADGIETWWDFEAFGARGKTAAKMLDIVHEHKVACTNCHLRHGDFRLTDAGKAFQKDETIIKKVPLAEILK